MWSTRDGRKNDKATFTLSPRIKTVVISIGVIYDTNLTIDSSTASLLMSETVTFSSTFKVSEESNFSKSEATILNRESTGAFDAVVRRQFLSIVHCYKCICSSVQNHCTLTLKRLHAIKHLYSISTGHSGLSLIQLITVWSSFCILYKPLQYSSSLSSHIHSKLSDCRRLSTALCVANL